MRRPRGGTRTLSARLVVLAISMVAAGIAAYLASGGDKVAVAEAVQLPTVEILVAKSDIGLGQAITPERLQWQTWPQSTTGANFIRRTERPNATAQLVGSVARAPFIEGEPIRDAKLVSVNGTGFMAAILPTGMRAISTTISPETGAGGFILPNDRVDVILSKREKSSDLVRSQVVLSNMRVLAIDQAPKEKDGQNAVIGRTATLEASPEQAETLARAHMRGTLSLALRSITDGDRAGKATNKTIAIYRGVGSQSLYNCTPVCDLQ